MYTYINIHTYMYIYIYNIYVYIHRVSVERLLGIKGMIGLVSLELEENGCGVGIRWV